MHSENFVQLPQLESPSLPLIKRPSSSVSLISENNNSNKEVEEQNRMLSNNSTQKVTDWRALDKFVASQLSQEDTYDGDGVSKLCWEQKITHQICHRCYCRVEETKGTTNSMDS
ncbi:3-oxo-5-alpha-steroid 4-dehydrogenase family protein isoform 1 [Populus alba x Populus x berolinensis]|uniref:3-oxo-5-alpha-steroid 4-dehydrogenase family protein isoform 1 n=1 Tax=Populus alba x Populus x berolinensis TaxID=444605 RepID=A0AAD6QG07_9ROSI|nr:3-oxo-5-alpha-steroid 4-dehydrogenase family protein isoform 1 [Populus alba x Populus x berolinensis]